MTTMPHYQSASRGTTSGRIRLTLGLASGLLFGIAVQPASGAAVDGDADVRDVGEPFDVKAFAAYSLPADKNAVSWYLLAARALVGFDKGLAFPRIAAARASARAAAINGCSAANEDARQWLNANKKALEVWKLGTGRTEAIEVPLDEYCTESLLPACDDARTLVALVLLKASQLADAGDVADAWTWYRASLRASRHLGMHGGGVERLVGTDLYRLARDPILHWAARPEVTAPELRQALEDVLAIDAMTAPISRTLKVEYLSVRHSIPQVLKNLKTEHPFVAVATRESGRPEKMLRVANLYFANWLANSERPRSQRRPMNDKKVGLFEPDPGSPQLPPPRVLKKLVAMQLSGLEANMGVIRIPPVDYALPGMMFLFDSVDQDRVNRAAVIVGLALQLHFRERSRFPQALSKLVKAGYLRSIPLDPFGQGEPVHYRLEGGSSDHAIVWSVGLDRITESGKLPTQKVNERISSVTVFEIKAPRKSASGK
jgi:hypothetical protein